ncbi:MAG TPA: helix-turn-helix domain-containing protein, partial [Planctomycetota bacterium]|nr:helix-turn-helix domain-containing protein [Planctomycetota bacterium]
NGFEEAADALDDRVVAALGSYAWPGNVRELGNVLLRAAIEGDGTIDPQRFPQMLRHATSTVFPRHLFDRLSLELLRTRLESDYLRHHLHRLGGDVDRLAEFLQTSRRQLYRRLERAGISIRAERRRMRKRAE